MAVFGLSFLFRSSNPLPHRAHLDKKNSGLHCTNVVDRSFAASLLFQGAFADDFWARVSAVGTPKIQFGSNLEMRFFYGFYNLFMVFFVFVCMYFVLCCFLMFSMALVGLAIFWLLFAFDPTLLWAFLGIFDLISYFFWAQPRCFGV